MGKGTSKGWAPKRKSRFWRGGRRGEGGMAPKPGARRAAGGAGKGRGEEETLLFFMEAAGEGMDPRGGANGNYDLRSEARNDFRGARGMRPYLIYSILFFVVKYVNYTSGVVCIDW